MTDQQMAIAIFKWLNSFIKQSDWLDMNMWIQARALFTAFCVIGGLEADTLVCDTMLVKLYNNLDMQSVDIKYHDFENFMVELIV